MANVTLAWKM